MVAGNGWLPSLGLAMRRAGCLPYCCAASCPRRAYVVQCGIRVRAPARHSKTGEVNLVALGLKRIDHVSMAVWKLDEQVEFFTKVFGWKEAGRFSNEKEGFAGCVLDVPGADGQRQMQWEILEPIGDNSFIA